MRFRFVLSCILVLMLFSSLSFSQLDTIRHLDVQPIGSYSAIWGYTAPDGREYAILGVNGSSGGTPYPGGTSIIDITDSATIQQVAFINGLNSSWREMKTYRHYAYVVTEAGGGVQIINLSQLPDTAWLVKSFNYTSGSKNILRSHSVTLTDGFLYLNGCANWSPGGTVIFDLRTDPENPVYVGEYQPEYLHDIYVLRDTIYGSAINSGGGLNIANATNKSSITTIGKITYSGSGTHNAWLTKDRQHIITTDEIGTTAKTLKIWNIGSLPTIPTSPVSTFTANPGEIEHNVTVRGDYAYTAWYSAGVRIVNVSNAALPTSAGSYDTSPTTSGYNGVWGIYPYFPSGKVIAGDMQNGLWVFRFSGLKARLPVSLQIPAHSATVTCGTPETFRWTRTANPVNDPHQYVLSIWGPGVDLDITKSDTSHVLSDFTGFQSGQQYQWFVTVIDEFNNTASQDTFSFTFTQPSPPTPSLVSPADEALDQLTTVTVKWNNTPCISTYHLQVSTDSLFGALVLEDSVLTDTSRSISSLANDTEYYWRVKAKNPSGSSAFSSARSFTTVVAPPSTPVLVSPGDEAVDLPVVADLVWNPSPAALTYRLQLSDDSLFSTLLVNDSTLTDTSFSTGSLNYLTSYFWRVRASNAGGVSPFSPSRSFTTIISPPAVPAQTTPADGSTGLPTTVTVGWNSAMWAQMYHVQIATDSAFSSMAKEDSTLAGTSSVADSLELATSYFWRVRSKNYAFTSAWSPTRVFTTTFETSRSYAVGEGWNLVSVPLVVPDFSDEAVFPGAISNVFAFIPTEGYVGQDSLGNGSGYWVKYGGATMLNQAGSLRLDDTVAVEAGWNLVGTLSEPAAADSVTSVPAGIIVSDFFSYNGAYSSADTLQPFAGYWVKVNSNGVLILHDNSSTPDVRKKSLGSVRQKPVRPARMNTIHSKSK